MSKHLILLLSVIALSACAVRGDYTCGVPNSGVSCQSMSDTHAQMADGTLASLHTAPFDASNDKSRATESKRSDGSYVGGSNRNTRPRGEATTVNPRDTILSVTPGDAILSDSRVMRIWFDRFTDPEGNLHDESFVFVRVDNGQWVIDNKPVQY